MPFLACYSHYFQVEGLDLTEFERLAKYVGLSTYAEPASEPALTFEFSRDDQFYRLEVGGTTACARQTLELAFELVRSKIHRTVNHLESEMTFISADCICGSDGRAVLIVGPPVSGKSTLAKALIKAGARPLSEHFAVVAEGPVLLPYPAPEIPSNGIPVGAIVYALYRPKALWQPISLSAGESVLCMVEALADSGKMTAATMPRLSALASQAQLRVRAQRSDAESVVTYLKG